MGVFPNKDKTGKWQAKERDQRGEENTREKEKGNNWRGCFNLSTQVSTNNEKAILDKGLKFAPPKGLNKFQTFMDIHKYIKKVYIKCYFLSNPVKEGRLASTEIQSAHLSNASLFNPQVEWHLL